VRVDERLAVRNGRVEEASADRSEGLGVRVRVGGAWGFAATRDTSRDGAERALARALAVAEAQPTAAGRPRVVEPAARGHWAGPCIVDPFSLSLEYKLELLTTAELALRVDPRLVRTEAGSVATRIEQAFASTDGAACTQVRTECGGGLSAVAVEGDELQIRSFPSAHGGHVAQAGWEHFEALDLVHHAERTGQRGQVELRSAPPGPGRAGRRSCLGPEQLGPADPRVDRPRARARPHPARRGGVRRTSWVQEHDLVEPLRYGSEHLTITADATIPGRAGHVRLDDEGNGRAAHDADRRAASCGPR
jgi:TldD protein